VLPPVGRLPVTVVGIGQGGADNDYSFLHGALQ
jgi:hypothetical protein